MGIPKAAASALSIHPGEGRSASLMLLHSFCMGTGTVFFETAASALFLAHFGSELLPYVYIAAAVVNTLTGILYSAVQERVRFARLMVGTLAFLLTSIVAFRLGLWVTGAGWLTFGLLVFYRVLSALTDLEYWAVATRLYDVRQAKRLFGMIGSGEVVARIAGSFSVPFLVRRIGVAGLVLVSAAGIAGCLALLLVLLGGADAAGPRAEPRRDARSRPAGGLRRTLALLASRYLLLLLSITFFAILAKYFVDFAFLEQMKSRYDGATQLASFFGLFSGVTQVLSLLTRVFVSGAVLGRFGIRAGLLVLPLAHAVCTGALALGSSFFGAGAGAVFWLVIANQAIYKVLKHPIDNPSFKVLYQPLRPEQRLAAQIAVETIVTPITTGLAGIVMLLFTVVIPYHPVRFAWAMLVTFAGWVAVALRAGRAYPMALTEALKGRIVDEEFSFDDERSMAILEERLRSERTGEVLFALDLLEKGEHPRLAAILVDLLDHPSSDVRSSALSRIEVLRPASALAAVRQRVEAEASVPVRAAALRCLCALGGEAVSQEAARYLEDPDPQMRRAALIGLLRRETEAGASFAFAYLDSLADSRKPEKRVLAAQVVAEVGRPGLASVLVRLLEDDVPSVRRAALVAASKVKDAALWSAVTGSLSQTAFAGLAGIALASGGEAALPALESAWERGASAPVRARVARIWGRIGGARATAALQRAIDFPDQRVRQEALESLRLVGYRTVDEDAVQEKVRGEVADAAWELACLRDLGEEQGLRLMRDALDHELEENLKRIFLLLSFLHDPTAILRARDHLAHASKEKRAYAIEILDVTLPRELQEIVLPLCEELPVEERCQRLEEHFPQRPKGRDAWLRELVERPDQWLLPWTRACALYTIGTLEARGLADAAVALRDGSADPLARETAVWALARMAGTAGGGRKAMLAIEKVITLKAVPMFARASEEDLADIASILEEVEVKAGEVVFRKGEVGDSMYIVVDGRVRVFDEDETIAHLGENEIFGELALLDPEPRVASIEAVEDTRLFRLDREAFSELMAGSIEIVRGVLSVLCERLRKAS